MSYLPIDAKSRKRIIKQTITDVEEIYLKHMTFDAIVCRGASGLLVAPSVAEALGIPLIYVRKPNETSHGYFVEEDSGLDEFKYLIVDDFISTGRTVTETCEAMKRNWRDKAKFIGVYCYNGETGYAYSFTRSWVDAQKFHSTYGPGGTRWIAE